MESELAGGQELDSPTPDPTSAQAEPAAIPEPRAELPATRRSRRIPRNCRRMSSRRCRVKT